MTKKNALAILAVFVAWSAMDFVIHGVILASAYASTPALWRPMGEMKMGLMYFTVLVAAAVFVVIYALFISEKSVKTGVKYGLLYGLGAGIAMGYGTYSVMPIPYTMAFVWFLGSVVEAGVAGWIAGIMIRK